MSQNPPKTGNSILRPNIITAPALKVDQVLRDCGEVEIDSDTTALLSEMACSFMMDLVVESIRIGNHRAGIRRSSSRQGGAAGAGSVASQAHAASSAAAAATAGVSSAAAGHTQPPTLINPLLADDRSHRPSNNPVPVTVSVQDVNFVVRKHPAMYRKCEAIYKQLLALEPDTRKSKSKTK